MNRNRPSRRRSLVAAAGLFTVLGACRKPHGDAVEPGSSATLHSADLPPNATAGAPPAPVAVAPGTVATTAGAPPAPLAVASASIATVEVAGDRNVLVVAGAQPRRPIVYLHGMCTEPSSDLAAWGATASDHGTVVALHGNAPCASQPGRFTWTLDATAIDARIDAALGAVDPRGELDRTRLIVIGESMGASRAAALAGRFPEKYRRLVLVSEPEAPNAKLLANAAAVALLVAEKEPQEPMRRGASNLDAAGVHSRLWAMPGATHGTYGPDGAKHMHEALDFVSSR